MAIQQQQHGERNRLRRATSEAWRKRQHAENARGTPSGAGFWALTAPAQHIGRTRPRHCVNVRLCHGAGARGSATPRVRPSRERSGARWERLSIRLAGWPAVCVVLGVGVATTQSSVVGQRLAVRSEPYRRLALSPPVRSHTASRFAWLLSLSCR
jgi:hypothetical protein